MSKEAAMSGPGDLAALRAELEALRTELTLLRGSLTTRHCTPCTCAGNWCPQHGYRFASIPCQITQITWTAGTASMSTLPATWTTGTNVLPAPTTSAGGGATMTWGLASQ